MKYKYLKEIVLWNYFLVFFCIHVSAQKHDYNWYTGYTFGGPVSEKFGITHIDFNTESLNPRISIDSNSKIDFLLTINSMSDFEGNFLFNYNGQYLENYLNTKIPNSNLTAEVTPDVFNQIALILPRNSDSEKYDILYKEYYSFSTTSATKFIRKALVDITDSFGGKLDYKNKVLINDTIQLAGLSATLHGNGKDWWIICLNTLNNIYYSIRLEDDNFWITKNTLIKDNSLTTQQNCFSPNGNYFSASFVNPFVDSLRSSIVLCQFDRIKGILSNPKSFNFNDIESYQSLGVAFSPNSRFLYISRPYEILQIDLTESLLTTLQVASIDTSLPTSVNSSFGFLSLAPDGRIYGTSSCCHQRKIFVIDKPNLKGLSCNVIPQAITITTHTNLPSFPNYRLGPIDGSVADSLGINNIPVAEYRYDQDSNLYKKIEFTNLSWHEPTEWWWEWGDGSPTYYTTQWDTSITHIFPNNGTYHVCLKAKNINGENTICKEINLGTTGNKELSNEIILDIEANPTRDLLILQLNNYLPEQMHFQILNVSGQLIETKRIFEGSTIINISQLPPGNYLLNCYEKNHLLKTMKFVKF